MTAPVLGSGSDPTWMARVPKPSSASWSSFLGASRWVGRLRGDPSAIGAMVFCADQGGMEWWMVFRHTCAQASFLYGGVGWDLLTVPLMKARKDDAFASYFCQFFARDRFLTHSLNRHFGSNITLPEFGVSELTDSRVLLTQSQQSLSSAHGRASSIYFQYILYVTGFHHPPAVPITVLPRRPHSMTYPELAAK